MEIKKVKTEEREFSIYVQAAITLLAIFEILLVGVIFWYLLFVEASLQERTRIIGISLGIASILLAVIFAVLRKYVIPEEKVTAVE